MSVYYYLIAQLPYLTYGQNPPMSSVDFIDIARTKLSDRDAKLLDYCTLGATLEARKATSSAFINQWQQRERTLMLNLAQARAARLKREGSAAVNYDPPHDPIDAENQAKTALLTSALTNPLDAEVYIDKGRWEAIDNLVGVAYFDVNAVYAYLLKLRLIERRASWTVNEGFAEYQALYASIMESAPQVGAQGDSE
ncbi:MAG: hypothetical protein Ta2B_20790 [Termitinemataceae bacterium]|nr:MAG: hypothetical protein Ta2B_20790 [Termitinemataceae bacterium]